MEITKEKIKKLNKWSLFKVTNFNDCCKSYRYVDGLNIANDSFGDDPINDTAIGFYFVSSELLNKYCEYGIKIRKLKLPIDDPELRVIESDQKHKYYANRIILEPRSVHDNIWTYSDLDKLRNVSSKSEIEMYISYATNYNDFQILDWCKNSGIKMYYPIDAIKKATINGNIMMLDWWFNNYHSRDSKMYCQDTAFVGEKIESLNWWFNAYINYGIEFYYSSVSIDYASESGTIEVLEWWFDKYINFGLELKYTKYAIYYASRNRKIESLNWWLNKKNTYHIELKYSEPAIDYALVHGHLDVLEWWKQSGLTIIHSKWALSCALINNHIDVLEWWKKLDMPLKLIYTFNKGIASYVGEIKPLNKTNNYVIHNAATEVDLLTLVTMLCETSVFDWLKENNLMTNYDQSIETAAKCDRIDVLDWWLKNKDHFKLKYNREHFLYNNIDRFSSEVLIWWFSSGLIVDVLIENIFYKKQLAILCEYLKYIPVINTVNLNFNTYTYPHNFDRNYAVAKMLPSLESSKIDTLKLSNYLSNDQLNNLTTFLKINPDIKKLHFGLCVNKNDDKLFELISCLNNSNIIELKIELMAQKQKDEFVVYEKIVELIKSNYTILDCHIGVSAVNYDLVSEIRTTLNEILERNNKIFSNKRFAKTKAILPPQQ